MMGKATQLGHPIKRIDFDTNHMTNYCLADRRLAIWISLGNRLPLLSVRVHVEPGTSLRTIATLTESKGRGLDNRRDIRKSYYVLASFYARPNAFPAIFREK